LSVVRRYKVDRILHTAALLAGPVRAQPMDGVRVNIVGTASVLEAARLGGASRVVLCSSNVVMLGVRDGSQPLAEDFPLRVVTEHPPSIYAGTKLYCEWL